MPTGGRVTGRWLAPSPLVVRVAGLPVDALAGLRTDRSYRLALRLLDARAELAAEAAALCDGLHAAIGELVDGRQRPGLVGLRRALHQGRSPREREWNADVAAALPTDLASGVSDWLARAERCRAVTAELLAVLSDELVDQRERLRDTVGDPAFRHALAAAAPTLLDIVDSWLADDREPERRRLSRLAKYVARAAAKTSPYSTFTVSGFGTWADGGPSLALAPLGAPLVATQLHGLLVDDVSRALAAHPALRPATSVRVNPSATEDAGRITFVGRQPGEPLVVLPVTPALQASLRLVDEGVATFGELPAALLEATGADPMQVHTLLDPLVETGLLEARPPVADHAADPLGELLGWLDRAAPAGLGDVRRSLARAHAAAVRPVPVAAVDDWRDRERELRAAVDELARLLELPRRAPDGGSMPLLHETGVAAGPLATCSLHEWAPVLDELDLACRWLSVFSPKLAVQLAIGTWFRERYGARGRPSFVAFYRAVLELAHHPETDASDAATDARRLLTVPPMTLPPSLATSRLDRLRELHRLRTAARDLAAGRADGGYDGDVVRLAPSAVADQLAGWPDWVVPAPSVACYVQPLLAHDRLRLVLNMVQGGPARGRSRLRYLAELTGAAAPPEDPPVDSGRAAPEVLAEIGGLLGSSLNARAPAVPYEIDYPFTVSCRPPEQRIPLRDLVVELDPDLDRVRLRSLALDRVVVPLHLGMMVELMLPPAAAFLDQVFSPSWSIHPSMPPLLPVEDRRPPTALVARPRVEVGGVVVQRRRWTVPTEALWARRPEPDAERYVRVLGWLREHGIPERCFVRAWGGSAGRAKSRKPMHVDFASWPLVTVLEQMTAGSAYVLFEEALPAPDEAPGVGADRRVIELLVEVRAAGRSGQEGR